MAHRAGDSPSTSSTKKEIALAAKGNRRLKSLMAARNSRGGQTGKSKLSEGGNVRLKEFTLGNHETRSLVC